MRNKISLKIAKTLVKLLAIESVPASSVKHKIIDELVAENILLRKGKHKKTLHLASEEQLKLFLANQFQIENIYTYISVLERDEINRAELVRATKDSKTRQVRTFKGFLVNSYQPIKALLNSEKLIINPELGSFIFIYDFESFVVDKDVTVVGVENSENFRFVEKQKSLFKNITPLFVSRYPQNQSKDLIKWLKSIPNKYSHFGDFDIAGIGIYLNEYKTHLGERASFFIPKNIKQAIRENGNRKLYDVQEVNFDKENILESDLKDLLNFIENEKKGLEQEFYA